MYKKIVVKNMKSELRGKYKLIRDEIKFKKNKNKKIEEKVFKLLENNQSKVVAFYMNFSSEVSTGKLIEYVLHNGKIVVIPRAEKKELFFYKINSIKNNLKKNKYGIQEPIKVNENYVEPEKIEMIIVPGLCFDKEKNRLGYGGGYYDRYLRKTNAIKVGICFDEQIYEGILPTEKTDIKMDIIITDKNIY